eukprot:10894211-Alexandrium_andersonii.AAC.1
MKKGGRREARAAATLNSIGGGWQCQRCASSSVGCAAEEMEPREQRGLHLGVARTRGRSRYD